MFNSIGKVTILTIFISFIWLVITSSTVISSLIGLCIIVGVTIWAAKLAYLDGHLLAFLGGIFGSLAFFALIFYGAYLIDVSNGLL